LTRSPSCLSKLSGDSAENLAIFRGYEEVSRFAGAHAGEARVLLERRRLRPLAWCNRASGRARPLLEKPLADGLTCETRRDVVAIVIRRNGHSSQSANADAIHRSGSSAVHHAYRDRTLLKIDASHYDRPPRLESDPGFQSVGTVTAVRRSIHGNVKAGTVRHNFKLGV
jgi:hypothetical protein